MPLSFLNVSLRLFFVSFRCVLLSFWYNSLPRLHIFCRIGGWYTGECSCFLSCGVILYLYLCANVVFGPLGPKRSSITAQPVLQALTLMLLPHISLISLFTSVSIQVRLLLLPKQLKSAPPPTRFGMICCSALTAGLTAAAVIFGYIRCFIIFHKLVRSAQHLHDSMFNAVIRTSVHFFDVNPIGEPGFQIILQKSSCTSDNSTFKSL